MLSRVLRASLRNKIQRSSIRLYSTNLLASNPKLKKWVEEQVKLCQPDKVHVCTGTEAEYQQIQQEMIQQGKVVQLNPKKRPNCILVRSTKDDVARVERFTYICSEKQEDAGPTNNWVHPNEMKKELHELYSGCMKGRTMYVIPYSMGPIGSRISQIGVEISDSPYVALNMSIMTRVGTKVLEQLGNDDFVRCMHSVGKPILKPEDDVAWPSNNIKRIVHFPEERSIMSFGSGYGGNALLGKKCFALRIASVMARDEGWLAEHMLILGITNPEGKKKYVAAAFPSACGKTNLAMMLPTIPGWKVECVGDDIAWMKFGKDGRLYAINPESGFFGVAPGTSFSSNPNAMRCLEKNTVFTNCALTDDGDVWWEGMTEEPPKHLIDWTGKDWTPENNSGPAAHPNARFTTPIKQCPVVDDNYENPDGVPISAILFGGRRATTIPLVFESYDWEHGTFVGTAVSSETTAAAEGEKRLRHDPFAMLPFCGYNMGDYFGHWLKIGKMTDPKNLPKIYQVNWFRKDKDGNYLWPGFGENSRVLKWIFERLEGRTDNAVDTPLGRVPTETAIDLSGLDISRDVMKEVLKVDNDEVLAEVKSIREYFKMFDRLPPEIAKQLDLMEQRVHQQKLQGASFSRTESKPSYARQ